MNIDRRKFVLTAGTVGAAAVGGLVAPIYADDKEKETEEDISAPEDLMREHGVLNRILR